MGHLRESVEFWSWSKIICPRWGSNSRPSDYETDALPTALQRRPFFKNLLPIFIIFCFRPKLVRNKYNPAQNSETKIRTWVNAATTQDPNHVNYFQIFHLFQLACTHKYHMSRLFLRPTWVPEVSSSTSTMSKFEFPFKDNILLILVLFLNENISVDLDRVKIKYILICRLYFILYFSCCQVSKVLTIIP